MGDMKYGPLHTDSKTANLLTINTFHNDIHEGRVFSITVSDDSMEEGDALSIGLAVPDSTEEIHLLISHEFLLGGKLEIYEDVEQFEDGTALTSMNLNRNSSAVSTVETLLQNPTSVGGTLLNTFSTYANNLTQHHEMILKSGALYLFKLISETKKNACTLLLHWSENIAK